MRECIRDLCVLSIFCGAVISLCPEGGVKKILQILETAVLLAVIVNACRGLDLSSYTVELARFHEKERELAEGAGAIYDRLDRLVIEDEYASYIERKAKAAGISPMDIEIRARWSKEGLWIPDSSRIHVSAEVDIEQLKQILMGELGIPPERQEWIKDE